MEKNIPSDKQVPETHSGSSASALPGRGGLRRIWGATLNSIRGIRQGAQSEAAIRQELAIGGLGILLSFILAANIWQWLALVGSLLLVLAAEFLNTAIEHLCNHVTPQRHDDIRDIKDIASAGVFFMLVLAGLVWFCVLLSRLGIVG
ncbi:MAG: diacylglycerol kinase [Methyloligellaceae bacterium]